MVRRYSVGRGLWVRRGHGKGRGVWLSDHCRVPRAGSGVRPEGCSAGSFLRHAVMQGKTSACGARRRMSVRQTQVNEYTVENAILWWLQLYGRAS